MTAYYALHPAKFKLDGGAMFGIIPKPLWEKKIIPDEFNRIEMSLRVLLIKKNDRVIMVDTGIGDYHDLKFNQRFGIQGAINPLETCLAQAGFKLKDVTDLILTHLHFDHVGGLNSNQHTCLFPNATIHLHKDHYHYALNPTPRDQGSFQTHYFQPLIEDLDKTGKLKWHQGEEGQFFSDNTLSYRVSHGHTPFMLLPYDENFIYMADLVPTIAHTAIPWVMGYDISPGLSAQEKQALYPWIKEKNLTMIFEHDCENFGATLNSELKPIGLKSTNRAFEPLNI